MIRPRLAPSGVGRGCFAPCRTFCGLLWAVLWSWNRDTLPDAKTSCRACKQPLRRLAVFSFVPLCRIWAQKYRLQAVGRRTSGGKLAGSIRRHICQRWMIRRAQKARPGNPGQAVMILLDAPALGQDRERDKRPAALGVVNDAGHAVSVGGQLVAIRASENVLAPVSGLCRLKSCGQLYGNAPGSCPANLWVLLKRYLCGLARLDHVAGAGDI